LLLLLHVLDFAGLFVLLLVFVGSLLLLLLIAQRDQKIVQLDGRIVVPLPSWHSNVLNGEERAAILVIRRVWRAVTAGASIQCCFSEFSVLLLVPFKSSVVIVTIL